MPLRFQVVFGNWSDRALKRQEEAGQGGHAHNSSFLGRLKQDSRVGETMADLGNVVVPASFCADATQARKEGILILYG